MREISLNLFLKTMRESSQNEKRYCFILGAGASRESGIRTGEEMAREWYLDLNSRYLPAELKSIMAELDITDITPSSRSYFDLYALRFYPDYQIGSAYLARAMERAQPSFGYYPLARHLAESENNLVITTNFDSLVEDALFIYTDRRPLVIAHELLADYININTRRPIVAKLHRGLFFDPLNRRSQVDGLSEKWKAVLRTAFQIYTPVVIGYAGGDHSLMDFLKDDTVKMNGLYWCYRHEEPPEEIQALVESKGGYFVPIEGFDEMMYLLGREFGYENPGKQVREIAERRAKAYEEQLERFGKKLGDISQPTAMQSQLRATLDQQRRDTLQRLSRRIEQDPNDGEAYLERGKNYYWAGDTERALEDFDIAVELAQDEANARFYRALTYERLGRKEDAVAEYTTAIALDDTDWVSYLSRGELYEELGKYHQALNDYGEALEWGGEQEALLSRGNLYEKLGRYQEAIEDYSEILEQDPDADDIYNRRGLVFWKLGDQERAIEDYTQAISRTKGDAQVYLNNRAASYIDQGEYEKAFSDCEAAIQKAPEFANPYYHRGRGYAALGKLELAKQDFEKAISLRPEYEEARSALERVRQELEQTAAGKG